MLLVCIIPFAILNVADGVKCGIVLLRQAQGHSHKAAIAPFNFFTRVIFKIILRLLRFTPDLIE